MDSPTFAHRIARMRVKRGMTVQELATKANTTYQTLWRIENRHAEAGIYLATRLARALGCSLDYLCGVHDEDEDEVSQSAVAAMA
jgi:transcriptional regulator with XRE-family HTH domain